MVVAVSLDSEKSWRRQAVPWVHFVDGLINAFLVFLSEKPVVLDVVDELEVEDTPESVQELVFKALPA